MANKYGTQYTLAYVNVPSEKINPGEYKSDVEVMYMSIVGAAEMALADDWYLGILPAGARVLEAKIKCPATGATGIFDIGYLANGVDVADQDGFIVGADPGAAAVYAAGTGAAMGKKFTVATTVVLKPTEVTAAFTGKTLEFWILYTVV